MHLAQQQQNLQEGSDAEEEQAQGQAEAVDPAEVRKKLPSATSPLQCMHLSSEDIAEAIAAMTDCGRDCAPSVIWALVACCSRHCKAISIVIAKLFQTRAIAAEKLD